MKFHKLIRLHNKMKKTSLKARMNSETFLEICIQTLTRRTHPPFLALTNSQQTLTSLRYMTAVPDHTLDQPGYHNPHPPFHSTRTPYPETLPSLLPALLDLHNAYWKTGSVPQAWRDGVIPSHPQESGQRKSLPTKSFQTDCLNPLHREGLLVHPQTLLVVLHGRKRVHRQEHSEGLHVWRTWMH